MYVILATKVPGPGALLLRIISVRTILNLQVSYNLTYVVKCLARLTVNKCDPTVHTTEQSGTQTLVIQIAGSIRRKNTPTVVSLVSLVVNTHISGMDYQYVTNTSRHAGLAH